MPSLANNKEIFKQLVSQQYVLLLFLFSPLRTFSSKQNTVANSKLVLIYNSICYCIMLWWPSVYGIELKIQWVQSTKVWILPTFFFFFFKSQKQDWHGRKKTQYHYFIHHAISESEKFRREHKLFMLAMFVMKNSFKYIFINKLYFVN